MGWQGYLLLLAALILAIAPVFILRYFFHRSGWRWLSSHSTSLAVSITAISWVAVAVLSTRFTEHAIRRSGGPPASSPSIQIPESSPSPEPSPAPGPTPNSPPITIYPPPTQSAPPPWYKRYPDAAEPKPAPPKPTREDYEAALRLAVDLSRGEIAFDVPHEMDQGVEKTVNVHVANGANEQIANQVRENLGPAVQVEQIEVTTFMTVLLEGDKTDFDITALTKDDQFLAPNGYTAWAWSVVPLEPGDKTLHLSVGTRIKLPDGTQETMFRPLYDREINVKVNRIYQSKRFLGNNWQWLSATIAIPLLGFLWHNLKRRGPRITPMDPL